MQLAASELPLLHHLLKAKRAEGVLSRVLDVEKPILVPELLVYCGHERSRCWEPVVDKDEDGLLGRELDSLADDVDKLADSQVRGDKVLLLV